jgi:Holliday junction resolvase RusA-like endonuclease
MMKGENSTIMYYKNFSKCYKVPTAQQYKKNVQMANKHMKRRSMSGTLRKIPVKVTMWYHYVPTRVGDINKKAVIISTMRKESETLDYVDCW